MSAAGSQPRRPARRLDTVVARLLVLAGVPLLVVAVAAFLIYQWHVRPLVAREALSGLETANAAATALVEAWIDDQLSVVGYLADRPAAVAWDTLRMLEQARRGAQSFAQLHAAVYADRDGDVVVDSIRGRGGNVADRSYFRTALAGDPVVTNLTRVRTSGRPSIIVAQPVFGEADTIIGVAFAAVEPAVVADVLYSGVGGTDVVSVIVDQEGVVATGRDIGLAAGTDGLPGAAIDAPYTDRHGVLVYGIGRRIERTGWTVVSEVPAASVTTTFDRYNRDLATTLVVTFAAAAAMAIVVGLSIQVPVNRLGRLASEEDPASDARPGGGRAMRYAPAELRRVYESMLAMMETIAERQGELARSNELLEAAQDIASVGSWEYDIRSGAFTCSDGLLRIVGVPIEQGPATIGDVLDLVHPQERTELVRRFDRSLEADEPGFELEHRVRLTSTGEDRYVLHRAVHVRDDSGKRVRTLGIVMDITARHSVEESLRIALEEKSILLQELHHRVRNNLAVVEGLLSLQRLQLPEESRAHRVLADAQSRITSMALLHRYLYGAENLTQVNLAEYTHLLLDSLSASYGEPGVKLRESADDVMLDVNTAIPCGLVLNELVANAYKHAFPGREGVIDVRVGYVAGGDVEITVSDDGVGRPTDGDSDDGTSGLGSQLIHRLAEQIDATLDYAVGEGTRATLRFHPS